MRKNLAELHRMLPSKAPFLLTIIAEEMGTAFGEDDTLSSVDIALMVVDETNDAPQFNQEQ